MPWREWGKMEVQVDREEVKRKKRMKREKNEEEGKFSEGGNRKACHSSHATQPPRWS